MLQIHMLLLITATILPGCGLLELLDSSRKRVNRRPDLHIPDLDKIIANLEFTDSSPLTVAVGERFSLTVKVTNIDKEHINKILRYESGNSKPCPGDLKVELYANNNKNWNSPDYSSWFLSSGLEILKNGVAKFENVGFSHGDDTHCEEECVLIAHKLYFYTRDPKPEWCSENLYAINLNTNKATKPITIKKFPYAAEAEHLGDKNIKITVSKNGAPFANGKISSMSVHVPCEEWTWEYGYYRPQTSPPGRQVCVKPNDTKVFGADDLTLDGNGSWAIELDADNAWQNKVNTDVPEAERYDLAENICKVSFSLKAKDNVASLGAKLEEGKCNDTPQ